MRDRASQERRLIPSYAQPTLSSLLKQQTPIWTPSPATYSGRHKKKHGAPENQPAAEGAATKYLDGTMRKKECSTCGRTLPGAQFPKHPEGSKCTHDRETCRRCWHQWLESQVASTTPDQIKCAQCNNALGQGEIKALATPAVYERFLDAELKAAMSADPDFRWCIAKDCKSGQIHSEGEIFRCVQCGHKACASCNVNWHEDETCTAYQARTLAQPKEEEESAKAVGKIAKLCPGQGCGRKLEKISGCDHVTCTRCRHEFCWRCLAAQSEIRRIGNTAHKKDCKYHSHNLNIAYPFNAH